MDRTARRPKQVTFDTVSIRTYAVTLDVGCIPWASASIPHARGRTEYPQSSSMHDEEWQNSTLSHLTTDTDLPEPEPHDVGTGSDVGDCPLTLDWAHSEHDAVYPALVYGYYSYFGPPPLPPRLNVEQRRQRLAVLHDKSMEAVLDWEHKNLQHSIAQFYEDDRWREGQAVPQTLPHQPLRQSSLDDVRVALAKQQSKHQYLHGLGLTNAPVLPHRQRDELDYTYHERVGESRRSRRTRTVAATAISYPRRPAPPLHDWTERSTDDPAELLTTPAAQLESNVAVTAPPAQLLRRKAALNETSTDAAIAQHHRQSEWKDKLPSVPMRFKSAEDEDFVDDTGNVVVVDETVSRRSKQQESPTAVDDQPCADNDVVVCSPVAAKKETVAESSSPTQSPTNSPSADEDDTPGNTSSSSTSRSLWKSLSLPFAPLTGASTESAAWE